MTTIVSRPFTGSDDLALLIDFARQQTIARAPALAYMHPGDVAWQLYLATSPVAFECIHLWFEDGTLAGYAIFEPPLHSAFDLRNDRAAESGLLEKIIAWIEARRRGAYRPDEEIPIAYSSLGPGTVSTTCLESDLDRAEALKRHGFVRTELHGVRYRRSLREPIPEVPLPAGYRVRHATDADIEARAELHREAWSVWGPSRFSANRYRRLRETPGYRQELDIVVERAEGQLVSYCICWADEASGVGIFEPVGTSPDHTGRGLSRVAIHEGLRRMRALGLHTALIGTSSVNVRALALYPSCGFSFVEREDFWAKPVL